MERSSRGAPAITESLPWPRSHIPTTNQPRFSRTPLSRLSSQFCKGVVWQARWLEKGDDHLSPIPLGTTRIGMSNP